MKKIISTLLVCFTTLVFTFAQAPSIFKYQSVVRDNSGNIISNQLVKFRITLLRGSITGTTSYIEQHTTATNQFGIANLEIGNGSSSIGNIDTIQWGRADYFIKVELDPTGSSGFTVMGTSQLLSVPYALYANTAGNVPKIIAGSSDGGLSPTVVTGSGFTVTHPATGTYDITFSSPFTTLPTIVANYQFVSSYPSGNFAAATPVIVYKTINGFRLITGGSGDLVDYRSFSFIAIGN